MMLPITTKRTASAIAAFIGAAAAYVISRYAVGDSALQDLITAGAVLLAALVIPAAAAPVGTVDALRRSRGHAHD